MKFVNLFNYKVSNLDLKNLIFKLDQEENSNTKIINCMNPHSFVVSKKDKKFEEVLLNSYINLIDGVGISTYLTLRKMSKINRITGYDLFEKIISTNKPIKFFFLGSTINNLQKIKNRLIKENENCLVETYSPPFADKFSDEENNKIISMINSFKPDYLFIGMTAPKQEKWSYEHKEKIKVNYILNIGAVFDYYAGYFSRPTKIIRNLGFEWLFRIIQNPKLWKRTVVSLPKYIFYIMKEVFNPNHFISIKVIDKIEILNNKINNEDTYIFSAFNLAMTSNLIIDNIKNVTNFSYWSDGIFCKFFNSKIKKIAGNKFLENIQLDEKFKSIHVIGNLHDQDRAYLNKKFLGLEIIFNQLPFGEPEDLLKEIKDIKKESLILLTLPTPKQEQVAQLIISKFNHGKIICIGGGLSIASGYEKKCPILLERLGLEFIWRLRSETKRRAFRISKDIIIMIFSLITFRLSKLKISKHEQ